MVAARPSIITVDSSLYGFSPFRHQCSFLSDGRNFDLGFGVSLFQMSLPR